MGVKALSKSLAILIIPSSNIIAIKTHESSPISKYRKNTE